MPFSPFRGLGKEYPHLDALEVHDGPAVIEPGRPGTPGLLGLPQKVYQLFGGEGLFPVPVLGRAHLDHPQQMAADPAGLDEPCQFVTGEPTVDQQVVEPYAPGDGRAQHRDHVPDLGGEIFPVALCAMAVRRPFLGEPLFPLGDGKPVGPFPVLALFPVQREVQREKALAVVVCHEQPLESQQAAMGHVGIYPADQLDGPARLGQVGVVDYQAARRASPRRGLRPVARPLDQFTGDAIVQGAPVDAPVVQETVEHVPATGKDAVKGRSPVMVRILYPEQREQ